MGTSGVEVAQYRVGRIYNRLDKMLFDKQVVFSGDRMAEFVMVIACHSDV